MSKFAYEGIEYDMNVLHTKQLINLLRKMNGNGYCECCYSPEWVEKVFVEQKELVPIIKEELEKREHVPNRFEAKEIRKQKAIKQKNLKNRKYRNSR